MLRIPPSRQSAVARRALAIATGLGVALALASCYPGDVTDVSQLDVVITVHDQKADFKAFQTFALPDTVIEVVGDSSSYVPISHDYDDEVVARVRSSLEARGYVYEPDPETNPPDALVLVAASASNTTYIYYDWWSSWGWYYPGYPGWGWYYPPDIDVVSYDHGTLFMTMVDVRNPDTGTEKLPVVWAAAIRGLLEGTTAQIHSRIDTNIDRAFAQSPYLTAN
jgi:hypothetical protein